MLAVAIFAFVLFWKSAYKMGQPPLTSFSHWMGHVKGEILSKLAQITGRQTVKPDV
jgi:lipopolysaccharide export system permease protein